MLGYLSTPCKDSFFIDDLSRSDSEAGARPHALFCVRKPFFLRATVLSCHRDSHPTLDEMEMSTKKNLFFLQRNI